MQVVSQLHMVSDKWFGPQAMKKCYVSVLISVVKLSFNKICRIPVNLVPAAAAKQVV